MKGIVLAGGHGTRLYPTSKALSKQILPIYNKPMIFYAISTLMKIGIRQIAIITTPEDVQQFKRLLNDGTQYGCQFEFIVQDQPKGIAQGLILAENFIGNERIALILGDNFFYGLDFDEKFHEKTQFQGACVFARQVENPEAYGIVEFNDQFKPISIVEKPVDPKSNFAVTGLYFYDNQAIELAKNLTISPRGELEITDLNRIYLNQNKLKVCRLKNDVVWFDLGTFESLFEASNFVRNKEILESKIIGSIEQTAFKMNFINDQQFELLIKPFVKTPYGKLLSNIKF